MKKASVVGLLIMAAVCGRALADGQVIGLGDSLTDTGNFWLASGIPSDPYYNGRFSNGPLWIEILAEQLGRLAPAPSLASGTNFAFNGARVYGASPYGTPSLTEQAGQYLASVGGAASPDDLYVVWGGANDIFFPLTGQVPPVPTSDVVHDLAGVIGLLADAGAHEFLVPNLPPLGQTPYFNTTPLAGPLDDAADAFNAELAVELTQLEEDLGITIHQLDVHGLFEEVIADPAAFGLTNVTDSATVFDPVTGLGLPPAPADANDFLFFDSIHPTAAAHQLLADRALMVVTPEPASLAMWLLALLAAGLYGGKLFDKPWRRAG